jgi:hypothetical protein
VVGWVKRPRQRVAAGSGKKMNGIIESLGQVRSTMAGRPWVEFFNIRASFSENAENDVCFSLEFVCSFTTRFVVSS